MIDPKLASALVKARGEITNPERDKKGVFAGHKYAALENVLDEVQPSLQKNGVLLMQDIQSVAGGIRAVNLFIHETGAVFKTKGPLIMLIDKKPGTAGAAATYAKRYALLAALGIEADADQDSKTIDPDAKKKAAQQEKNPDQPAPRDAPGVDESGLDEMAIKRTYANQINALNAAAKAKSADDFAKEYARIPQEDRVAVHGAVLSYARTFSKSEGMASLIAEYEQTMNEPAEGLL